MYAGTFKPNIADLGRGMQVCIGTGFVGSDMLGEATKKFFSLNVTAGTLRIQGYRL